VLLRQTKLSGRERERLEGVTRQKERVEKFCEGCISRWMVPPTVTTWEKGDPCIVPVKLRKGGEGSGHCAMKRIRRETKMQEKNWKAKTPEAPRGRVQ